MFSKLDVQQLEELAADSQALLNKASAMVEVNTREGRMTVLPSPAEFRTSRQASPPSTLPDVDVADTIHGDAVAWINAQPIVSEPVGVVQANGMAPAIPTPHPAPVDEGDRRTEPAETPTGPDMEEA